MYSSTLIYYSALLIVVHGQDFGAATVANGFSGTVAGPYEPSSLVAAEQSTTFRAPSSTETHATATWETTLTTSVSRGAYGDCSLELVSWVSTSDYYIGNLQSADAEWQAIYPEPLYTVTKVVHGTKTRVLVD